MRLRLDHIDAAGLELALPGAREGADQRVVVRSAAGLKGLVEQGAAGLRLSEVQIERVVLEALRLVFGSVVLTQEGGATLAELRVGYEQSPGETVVDLQGDVQATRLAVDVASVHVAGEARIEGMRLRVRGGQGSIEAEQVTFSSFELRLGGLKVTAERVEAQGMIVAWGEGFRLEARTLTGPAVDLDVADLRARATELDVRELDVHGGDVSWTRASIGSASVEAASILPARTPDDGRPTPASTDAAGTRASAFDWRLLDGLHGELGVDLAVDLTVPVIGRRRATHRFRVPIERGTIDYMSLENDLSTLENTLLDFAVREGALVLERGIPLLPTRGRGKPIIVWKLGEEDLALAERHRVRLAVLPGARLANEGEGAKSDAKPESPPSVALRRLALQNIHARLGLASVEGVAQGVVEALCFEALAVQGAVHHDPEGEPRQGGIQAELTAVETSVVVLPLGRKQLQIEHVRLVRVSTLELGFEGLRPSTVRMELAGLGLGRTSLREA